MTNIVVLIKQVPDTNSDRLLAEGDFTLDRAAADLVLDEINERAIEEALVIKDAGDAEVTVVSVGPDDATDAIRRALAMGADKGIHVSDEALRGTDIIGTAKVLAKAIATAGEVDLIIAGNASTDGWSGAVPGIVADLLGLPALTHLRKVSVDGATVTGTRETEEGLFELSASLPALVSVTEKVNEPRYPSFKGIMAAKKKPVESLVVSDLGLSADEVGFAGALTTVTSALPKPPRAAGERVVDEGNGGVKVAEYLVAQKII